jgi:hypothetical protein
MEKELEQFRQEVERLRAGRRRGSLPYPEALRAFAVRYVAHALETDGTFAGRPRPWGSPSRRYKPGGRASSSPGFRPHCLRRLKREERARPSSLAARSLWWWQRRRVLSMSWRQRLCRERDWLRGDPPRSAPARRLSTRSSETGYSVPCAEAPRVPRAVDAHCIGLCSQIKRTRRGALPGGTGLRPSSATAN